ncbi:MULTISPECIES: DUF1983 domain-containing protein [Delftia]|uniref:phage tail tip fiber protein n=1 Tax=Delftia TaxID=80865 RepID=UPI000F4B766D|nr:MULTISPECIES: DUF1983 domain-containing protein [Delftia]MBD9583786.1 DUF1983 domain-containing protein [Delftia sp. DLF01]MCG3783952.1 DUF1983 domain-containing protein [Delftia acidovorans]ROR02793.1 uncharacterized protein DUF1983 [Delftia acidovorans]
MTNRKKIDTGAARLPALARVNVQDKALSNWMQAVTEHLEVRSGARGNEFERGVTLRELVALQGSVQGVTQLLATDKTPGEGEIVIDLGGGLSATVAVERFAQSIIESRLFKSLAKTLDDPSRFDHLAQEIRDELLRSIADEAAQRGAEVRELQTVVQSNERSLAMAVREVTASLRNASAGLRATQAAFADGQRAMATNVLQLQASLGNYYQDGKPGRAMLEQEMTVLAGYSEGLRAQYTLKVQAGGALAGYGIAAEEVNGKTSSAFIIMADKFAIVSPSYNAGQMSTPRPEDVVFGVDGDGIYLQRNVYLKGNMRIDGLGKKLMDGLRGSVLLSASGSFWSDATARQAVWQALGNSGSAPSTNHLIVGDAVTISNGAGFTQTRHWMGAAWLIPAAVLNGDLLVDGTVAARKVDTRGLTVRDNAGNVILDANGLDAQWLRNLKAAQVSGLGPLATKDKARIGDTVAFPDGTTMNTSDFINRLQRITSNNIGVFMDTAAIGTAYIGQAAIGTLQIAGGSVTAMAQGELPREIVISPGVEVEICQCTVRMSSGGTGVAIVAFANAMPQSGDAGLGLTIVRDGNGMRYTGTSMRNGYRTVAYAGAFDARPPGGDLTYRLMARNLDPVSSIEVYSANIMATGGNR